MFTPNKLAHRSSFIDGRIVSQLSKGSYFCFLLILSVRFKVRVKVMFKVRVKVRVMVMVRVRVRVRAVKSFVCKIPLLARVLGLD